MLKYHNANISTLIALWYTSSLRYYARCIYSAVQEVKTKWTSITASPVSILTHLVILTSDKHMW